MRISLFLLLISISSIVSSKDANIFYPAASIPANLKEDVNSVIRLEQTQYKVISLSEAILKVRIVKTVLNEKGKREGILYLGYDKLKKVNSIKGNIYNGSGKLIEKLKSGDIKDVSAVSDFSLFEDNRIKIYEPKVISYPYTVEYEYEYLDKNLLFYPTWDPLSRNTSSIEDALLEIIIPKHFKLRFKQLNLQEPPQSSSDEKNKIINGILKILKLLNKRIMAP
ncbi:MAG: DUF3857 domain-containing protein [Bacteroidota bacterium]|nr:DUF3857 domain-containing protein [Bacteroidota bacterium]